MPWPVLAVLIWAAPLGTANSLGCWERRGYNKTWTCVVLALLQPPDPRKVKNAAKVGLWTLQESGGKSRGHSGKVGVKVGAKVQIFLA